jgi:hypothetical protein
MLLGRSLKSSDNQKVVFMTIVVHSGPQRIILPDTINNELNLKQKWKQLMDIMTLMIRVKGQAITSYLPGYSLRFKENMPLSDDLSSFLCSNAYS